MRHLPAIVIGAGPAGLTAGIYLRRNGVDAMVIGKRPPLHHFTIDNYFGFPEPVRGAELLERGRRQLERFGAELVEDLVLGYEREAGRHVVYTASERFSADCLIVATGAPKRKDPGIPGLERFEGKGVSYCAICDAYTFKGAKVAVVGAGDYAAKEALVLARLSESVTVVSHSGAFTMSDEMRRALENSGVRLVEGRVEKVKGRFFAEGLVLEDGGEIEAEGVFIAVGEPQGSELGLKMGLKRTPEGYIVTDPATGATSTDGIFAAGDCTGGLRQIAVAVGQGAIAGVSASTSVIQREAR